MTIKPLFDKIVVKPFEEETKTSSGIVLPGQEGKKQSKGKIVAVGQGAIRDDGTVRPLAVREGDVVLFNKYSGTEVRVNDEEFLIIREEDVLGVEV